MHFVEHRLEDIPVLTSAQMQSQALLQQAKFMPYVGRPLYLGYVAEHRLKKVVFLGHDKSRRHKPASLQFQFMSWLQFLNFVSLHTETGIRQHNSRQEQRHSSGEQYPHTLLFFLRLMPLFISEHIHPRLAVEHIDRIAVRKHRVLS